MLLSEVWSDDMRFPEDEEDIPESLVLGEDEFCSEKNDVKLFTTQDTITKTSPY